MSLPHRLYTSTGPLGCAAKLHQVALAPQSGEALAIGGYQLANRCNATIDVGLFARQPNALWEAGRIQANATPDYQNAATGAQSTNANAFVNAFTATNNDGFLVLSSRKFSAISFKVDDAANGSPIYAYKYYDGTNMTSLPATLSTPDFANAGASQLIFIPPADWAAGTTSAVQTANTSAYALQITASTAGGKVVSLSDVRVYEQLDYFDAVTDGNQLIDDLKGTELRLHKGYSLAPFFDSANAANFCNITYRSLSRNV